MATLDTSGVVPLGNGATKPVSAHEAIHQHANGTQAAAQVNGNSPGTTAGSTVPPLTKGSARQTSYPKSRVDLVDRFLDEPRKLRVAVIGGGLSGILSGILLPEKVPGIELVIYEKNKDFVSTYLPTYRRAFIHLDFRDRWIVC